LWGDMNFSWHHASPPLQLPPANRRPQSEAIPILGQPKRTSRSSFYSATRRLDAPLRGRSHSKRLETLAEIQIKSRQPADCKFYARIL
ncbi:hypothetical protein FRC08_007541, partial [Ceratobasidium sp. 394]